MKSAKKFIYGLLAFAGLCVVCTVFGAVAYSAGESSQPTATPAIAPTISQPTPAISLPTAIPQPTAIPVAVNESDFCTLKVRMYSDVIDSSVFLVLSGDMYDIACDLMEQSIKENMPSQEGMHAEVSRFVDNPEYPVYCSDTIDTGTFIEVKAENPAVGKLFCKGFLKDSQ